MQLRVATFVTLLCLALPAVASAAPWVTVNEHPGKYTDETGIVRGPDGTLHMVYLDQVGQDNFGIRYRTLGANGTLSAPTAVASGWFGPTNPDIELLGGTPTVVWSGLNTAHDGTPDAGGELWRASLGPAGFGATTLTSNTKSAYLDTTSTALDANGTLFTGWNYGVYGRFVRAGVDPTTADTNLQEGCCSNSVNLERDAVSGAVYMNFYSNITGQEGYWQQKVAPAVEGAQKIPGNVDSFLPHARRMSAAARTTGGVYTAICDAADCTSIRVTGQGVGQGLRLKRVGAEPDPNTVMTAAAPDGRLWLSYATPSAIYVTRSNKALTAWGPLQVLRPPTGTKYVQSLTGDGSLGFLDLVAVTTTEVTGASNISTTRITSQLQLTPALTTVNNGAKRIVKVRLTDAGEAVNGKVRFRGATYVAKNGWVNLVVAKGTPPKIYPVSGTAPGFAAAVANVKVVKAASAPIRRPGKT